MKNYEIDEDWWFAGTKHLLPFTWIRNGDPAIRPAMDLSNIALRSPYDNEPVGVGTAVVATALTDPVREIAEVWGGQSTSGISATTDDGSHGGAGK